MAASDLDDVWVDAVAAASQEAEVTVPGSGVVAFTIGKTKQATLRITDGRVTGPVDGGDDGGDGVEPDATIPVTAAQLGSFCDGSESMSRAFMRGDLKPVGAIGALLPVFALFDDAAFRAALESEIG